MDSILITGASGFIGGNIARALIDKGYRLRLQYRRSEPPPLLQQLKKKGAELLQLDLTSGEAVETAVKGMDGVIHAAALTGDWGSRDLFYRVNAKLPEELALAARNGGCRRFLFISSIAIHGFGLHRNTTEEGPYYPLLSLYQKTKQQAEQSVISIHSKEMKTTAIRPGNVYGPGDTTVFYKIFDAMMKGIMAYTGKGDKLTCPVYIDDIVRAIVAAYEKDESGGEVFNITGGEEVTWREIFEYTAGLLGVKPLVLRMPSFPARLLAMKMEFLYTLFRSKSAPPITRYRVDMVSYDYHFSIDKARRILGFIPETKWREGFRMTVEDYLAARDAR